MIKAKWSIWWCFSQPLRRLEKRNKSFSKKRWEYLLDSLNKTMLKSLYRAQPSHSLADSPLYAGNCGFRTFSRGHSPWKDSGSAWFFLCFSSYWWQRVFLELFSTISQYSQAKRVATPELKRMVLFYYIFFCPRHEESNSWTSTASTGSLLVHRHEQGTSVPYTPFSTSLVES